MLPLFIALGLFVAGTRYEATRTGERTGVAVEQTDSHAPAPDVTRIHVVVVAIGAYYARMVAASIRSILFHRRRTSHIEWHLFVDPTAEAYLRANFTLLGALPPCAKVNMYPSAPLQAQALSFLKETGLVVDHYVGNDGLTLAFVQDHVPPHVDRLMLLGSDTFFVDDIARQWDLFSLFDSHTVLRDQETPKGPLTEFFDAPPQPPDVVPGSGPILAMARFHPPIARNYRWRATWPDLVVSGGHLIDVRRAKRFNLTGRYVAAARFYKEKFGVTKLTAADQTLGNMFALTHPDLFAVLPCWAQGHTGHQLVAAGKHWSRSGWCRGEPIVNIHASPSRQLDDPQSRYYSLFRWFSRLDDGWLQFCPGSQDRPMKDSDYAAQYHAEGDRIAKDYMTYNVLQN
ncbi:hypothetical protein DFJ74DRAFT_647696 [Hyaloraphidium curvatum]|nr:hypothetical protein DFJ74DRAFT_647696 [Hyaloraphidium curvatum]